ncbi:lytic polysaccharide monooxygenase, partial [Streptomyces sp. DH12]
MRSPSRLALVLGTVVAALLCLVPWSGTAHAHGSVVDPASRNYGCWQRWGSDFQNPAMAQQDPMCWQAWQDNTNAMWNWNGLYRDGSGGNFRAVVPDGTLCSGGNTENGRYRSMDTPGAWKTTNVGSSFTVNLYDQARHGADYFLV